MHNVIFSLIKEFYEEIKIKILMEEQVFDIDNISEGN